MQSGSAIVPKSAKLTTWSAISFNSTPHEKIKVRLGFCEANFTTRE